MTPTSPANELVSPLLMKFQAEAAIESATNEAASRATLVPLCDKSHSTSAGTARNKIR